MRLFLSRIPLNPLSRHAVRMVSNLDSTHSAVYRLFDQPETARVLFRVDGDGQSPTILVQSRCEPDWTKLRLSALDLLGAPETKELSIQVAAGDQLAFRLLARATKAFKAERGDTRGRRLDLRSDEERMEWLSRKAANSGFRVIACSLTNFAMPCVHSRKGMGEKGGSFAAVRFDGEFLVTDPAALVRAVENGVGVQKGFGFGLLSLGRV